MANLAITLLDDELQNPHNNRKVEGITADLAVAAYGVRKLAYRYQQQTVKDGHATPQEQ